MVRREHREEDRRGKERKRKKRNRAGVLIPKGLAATRLAEPFSFMRNGPHSGALYREYRESYGLHTASQTSQCPNKSETTEGVGIEQMKLGA